MKTDFFSLFFFLSSFLPSFRFYFWQCCREDQWPLRDNEKNRFSFSSLPTSDKRVSIKRTDDGTNNVESLKLEALVVKAVKTSFATTLQLRTRDTNETYFYAFRLIFQSALQSLLITP